MSQSPWPYFSTEELKCKCGSCNSVGLEMDDGFMSTIVKLREILGFPFIISSAYRCPKHNNNQSKTGFYGPHTTGRAIDIAIDGERAFKLIKAALEHGITGVGVKQAGTGRFIHLDNLESPEFPRPRFWSY